MGGWRHIVAMLVLVQCFLIQIRSLRTEGVLIPSETNVWFFSPYAVNKLDLNMKCVKSNDCNFVIWFSVFSLMLYCFIGSLKDRFTYFQVYLITIPTTPFVDWKRFCSLYCSSCPYWLQNNLQINFSVSRGGQNLQSSFYLIMHYEFHWKLTWCFGSLINQGGMF